MNAAAIDLGTNSVKILIIRRDEDGTMHVLFRHRSVVRLGEGTFSDPKGKIPRYVQLRTLKVLQTYSKLLEAYKVDVVRATGTSALRDAKNGQEFVREVRTKTGIALEVLPAEQEAHLIVKGVASEIKLPSKPVLFIDIGGGSCEISLVHKKKIEKFVSLPLGAVRLTELYIPGSKPKKSQVTRLKSHVKKILKNHWPNPKKISFAFGSAGTIRSLARLISKTELTDDDNVILRKQLEALTKQILKMNRKEVGALPGIDNKRAEILAAGTVVLNQVFEHFRIDRLRVSQRGLREGMILDLFDQSPKKPLLTTDHIDESALGQINSLARKYQSNRIHCHQVWHLSHQLFEMLAPIHGLLPSMKEYLMTASLLHDVGRFVSQNSSHKHSYYIINNSDLTFLDEKEKKFVALLARYHRKSPPREGHEGYDQLNADEKKTLIGLAAILRLAESLDATRDQGVRWLKCQWGPSKVHISADLKAGSHLDMVTIKDSAKLFENFYNVTVTVSQASDKKRNNKFLETRSKL